MPARLALPAVRWRAGAPPSVPRPKASPRRLRASRDGPSRTIPARRAGPGRPTRCRRPSSRRAGCTTRGSSAATGARTATRESADQYPRLDDVGDAESDEARSESAEPVPGHQAAAAAQRGGPLPRDLGDGSHDQHQGRRGLRTAGWPHPCRAGRARVLGRARGAAGAVGLGRRARPQRRADARRPHRLAQAYPEPLALHLLQLSQAAAGDGRREPGSA